jgi:protoporphyrinogen oxidase
LETERGLVRSIRYLAGGKEGSVDIGRDDFVVSTLPLSLNTKLLSASLPPHLPDLSEKVLALNDLLLVFLHVDRPSLLDESWVFVPDPEIVFHRLSEQESFDPAMTPNGSIVCCEIMSSNCRPLAARSDDDLSEAAKKGLVDMGYQGFRVLGQRVIRLPKSYPVFRRGYEAGLTELLQALDGFDNFRSIGRQGAFNYIGTLDAMDIGYGFVDWLSTGRQRSWSEERARTSHYPVLD